jgi:uncharacterized membrane protein (UPF0136 family)
MINVRRVAVAVFVYSAFAFPLGVFAQTVPPATSTAIVPYPAPVATPLPLPSAEPIARVFKLAAFSDFGFTSVAGTNVVRFVDGAPSRIFGGVDGPFFDANGGRLLTGPSNFDGAPDLQDLNLQLLINGTGRFGGKVETSIGTDGNVFASNGQSRSGTNLTQAYLQYAAGPLTMFAGKIFGLAGYEVTDTTGNVNFSRDYLVAAVPSTLTGIRGMYVLNSKVSFISGVYNGWDDWKFAGKKKTVGGSVSLAPSPGVALALTTYNGSDFLVNGNSATGTLPVFTNRMLYDMILTIHATSALTLVANSDNATQLGDPRAALSSQHWAGIAGYAIYQFNPKYGLTVRKDTFFDAQGFRTGAAVPVRLQSNTFTFNYTPTTKYLFRLEYRLDTADGDDFAFRHVDGDAALLTGRNHQSSVGFEAVVKAP